jgi:DNA-binding CsgD family transcriptional regulator
MRKEGKTNGEIAEALGFNTKGGKGDTAEFRAALSEAKDQRRMWLVDKVESMHADGKTPTQIAKELGYKNESSIRALLDVNAKAKMNAAWNVAQFLADQCDEKGMIDVGAGTERHDSLNVSPEKMRQALFILQAQGYEVYGGRVPQVNNKGQMTTLKVLCPPGTEHKEIYNYDKIHTIDDYIYDNRNDKMRPSFVYPASMDSKRLQIRYAEDGGVDKDGVIELRRGVKDLDLGDSHYAQVRILVDGDRYLKGMAVYSDNLPDGCDVLFNTNKHKGTDMRDVLKEIKNDPENPFGSAIKPNDPKHPEKGGQSWYIGDDGKEHLSLINKRADEGDWGEWSKKLPSQFLAKQPLKQIKQQLGLTIADKDAEYDEICSLTNPTIKRVLLKKFADKCDSDAVRLQAAGYPNQRYQVILPLTSIKDSECYAPNFEGGSQVALVRFPHGGTFEIPILTVNNKNREGKAVLGNTPKDGIGISAKVAERLSGADFDGDTVLVIPLSDKVRVQNKDPLKDLKGFDPKAAYPKRDGMKEMHNTQNEMGRISNLITDMTIKGADDEELARAVKHSMVVIDAEKHKLDYKRSEEENGIAALRKKYQTRVDENGEEHGGASTLLSRAKSPTVIEKRKGSPRIDPATGEYIYKNANETYEEERKVKAKNPETGRLLKDSAGKQIYETVTGEYKKKADGSYEYVPGNGRDKYEKTGVIKKRTQASTQMADTRDAYSLVSDIKLSPKEVAYAEYANHMKALGNKARKEMLATKDIPYSASSKDTYRKEVASLNAKLNISEKNQPLERTAQTIASGRLKAAIQENPHMTSEEKRKKGQRYLAAARESVGAHRTPIKMTDREWEAIQAGAITKTKLTKIINFMDDKELKERAMPKASNQLSDAKIAKINSMRASGYTTDAIAEAVGVSTSTVTKYL